MQSAGMKRYRDRNGDSGIARYEYGPDWIRLEFKTGSAYEYTRESAGAEHIEAMKRLADSGDGLNAYLNRHAHESFSRQIR